MDYSALAETYGKLEEVPSKLKKTEILADLFKKTPSSDLPRVVLLIQGIVYPKFTGLELGIAVQMMTRAISKATGLSTEEVEEKFKKTGDLGLAVEECIRSKKQSSPLKEKLTVDRVFESLQRLAAITGKGSQEKKLNLIAELIVSAHPKEARYIVRTIIETLRVGAAEGIIRDAIVKAFLIKEDFLKEEKTRATEAVEYSWNIFSDFGEVARIAKEKGIDGLREIKLEIGKPIQVMLAEKADTIKEVLDDFRKDGIIVEIKYDGMRAQIHKKGGKVWIYTRRLEDVTKQFPDLVDLCKKNLKSSECIIEGEVLGIDPKTGNPIPFQALSQRIHRKYEIEKIAKEIPIQMNFFDAIYSDGDTLLEKSLYDRRKVLEKIVRTIPKKFQMADGIVTDDLNEVEKFYKKALDARQEGVMIKNLSSTYVFGRHVDGWVKIKPVMETLDLVIVGAIWGEGARANWLTSFALACRDPDTGKFLECGMMSTGLTENEYDTMTKTLKPLIKDEKGKRIFVKPKIVVEVKYQEIQKSTNYESGFALRFPALGRIREDRGPNDSDTISRVKKLYESQGRSG